MVGEFESAIGVDRGIVRTESAIFFELTVPVSVVLHVPYRVAIREHRIPLQKTEPWCNKMRNHELVATSSSDFICFHLHECSTKHNGGTRESDSSSNNGKYSKGPLHFK